MGLVNRPILKGLIEDDSDPIERICVFYDIEMYP